MLIKRGLYSFDSAVFGDTLDVNVVSSRFFMPNISQYKQIIGELCKLYEQEQKKRHRKDRIFEKFALISLQELTALHKQASKRMNHKYVIPFIKKYPFLNQPSSLQVINKLYHENYHSLFLKYIWDSGQKNGSTMFADFLRDIGFNEPWVDSVRENNYRVEEEHSIKDQKEQDLNKKRIDLLFVDETNKWVVVIENKINSEVRTYTDKNCTQLDSYWKYCHKERKFRGFTRRHILLSNNPKNARYAEESPEWRYANYYQVFKSLLKYASTDVIITDYVKTLFALLFHKKLEDADCISLLDESDCDFLHRNVLFYRHVISKTQ